MTGARWRTSSYSSGNGGACVEAGVWRRSSYSTANGGQCVEVGVWRSSSYSSGNGGQCVEVGAWRTASYSATDGNCVEVAGAHPATIAVRDSKDPDGPRLSFTPAEWTAFIRRVKNGSGPG